MDPGPMRPASRGQAIMGLWSKRRTPCCHVEIQALLCRDQAALLVREALLASTSHLATWGRTIRSRSFVYRCLPLPSPRLLSLLPLHRSFLHLSSTFVLPHRQCLSFLWPEVTRFLRAAHTNLISYFRVIQTTTVSLSTPTSTRRKLRINNPAK